MFNVILVLFIHWVADFVCQTHEMSIKKSKSIYWLSLHVSTYTAVTLAGWLTFFFDDFLVVDNSVLIISSITFLSHWVTDYFTSKWTSKLWDKKQVHNFFVVVGLDQLIHTTTLIITLHILTSIL